MSTTVQNKKTSNASEFTPKKEEVQTTRHAANTEERERLIASAAYFIAEKDGFQAGREKDYWYQAVAQVDLLLDNPQRVADKH